MMLPGPGFKPTTVQLSNPQTDAIYNLNELAQFGLILNPDPSF